MAAAVDNAVRVVFEAEWSKLQTAVTGITAKITGIGDAGDKADKKLAMKDARKGVQSLGDEGKKVGIALNDGFRLAQTGADALEQKINRLIKTFVLGYALNAAKNALKSFISEGQELIKSATENQIKLTQVMRNMMQATDGEIESIVALAEAQERLGVVSKTAQISALTELATFVERRESIERMLPVMNDYVAYLYNSNATEEQARNVATSLGKAIQGNIEGLSKQGFQLSENEREWFKTASEMERVSFVMNMVGESVGGINSALAKTDAKKLFEVNQAVEDMKVLVAQVFNDIKTRVLSQILPALQSVKATLENFANSGAWQSIANSLTTLINLFLNLLDRVLQRAPSLLNSVANALEWVSDNIFLIGKAIAVIIGLASGIKLISGLGKIVSGIAMIKTGVGIPAGISLIAEGGGEIISSLGGAAMTYTLWDQVTQLERDAKSGKSTSSATGTTGGAGRSGRSDSYQLSQSTLNAIEVAKTGGSSTPTDTRTPFEIAMDAISTAYATREDLIDSQISLAEAQGDKTARKSAFMTYIDTLGEKLKQITGLDRLAANSDELNILETTKNRILTEIIRITEDMNDSLTQLVGAFNVPSGFTALNEYEYITSDNTTVTRILNTPHVEMYMNFDKLDAKSGEEARQMTDDFLAALFNNGEMAKYMMGHIER